MTDARKFHDKALDSTAPGKLKDKSHIVFAVSWRVTLGIVSWYAVFSLSFVLSSYFYRWLGYLPSTYLNLLTTLFISSALLVSFGTIAGRLGAPRQRAFWQSLIDAFRQMARGNFDVRIDLESVREPGGKDHPFRQLVRSINDMATELGQLEEMRQEFISNVSHEIQSPLTSIAGFVDVLKSDDLTKDERHHYLSIIEAESKRLSRLSDNLLKLTSLESGHHPFHKNPYRLDRQIRDVVLSCEPLWRSKSIDIDLSLPHLQVAADEDLLSQLWMNLFTNAIKFTNSHGMISISLQDTDEQVEVSISDTGMGINSEDKSRIFERFYKADKARTGSQAGSGLGLAIAKKIVDIHQGEISLESQLGKGTTFLVRLPKENHSV